MKEQLRSNKIIQGNIFMQSNVVTHNENRPQHDSRPAKQINILSINFMACGGKIPCRCIAIYLNLCPNHNKVMKRYFSRGGEGFNCGLLK